MLYFGMEFKLEICVDNVESAIDAQNAGADRIELCGSLPEGGTTPGYGTISSARNNLTIGLHVIIRPRGGDFLYSDLDFDIMRRDIEVCGECGADGVVIGLLLPDGTIDVDRTAKLIEFARPMSVTFHRAFDLCNDPFKELEKVIDAGADRLLTSGQTNRAEEGIEVIRQIITQAADRLKIMPGSGINPANISKIARGTGAKEFHLTGRKVIESDMIYRKSGISMGGSNDISEYSRKVADPDVIRSIITNLKMI
jgi:copper homeostasis protein